MKKTLVMVFPEEFYVENEGYKMHELKRLSNNAEQHIDNGFSVVNILYGKSENPKTSKLADIPAIKKGRCVFSDTWEHFLRNKSSEEKFTRISEIVEVDNDDMVIVGGFHIGDCVNRTALKIQERNPNVLIDHLVTNAVRDGDAYMNERFGNVLDFTVYQHNKYDTEVFEEFNLASLSARFGKDHIKRLVEKHQATGGRYL